jgi:hypothetical protein
MNLTCNHPISIRSEFANVLCALRRDCAFSGDAGQCLQVLLQAPAPSGRMGTTSHRWKKWETWRNLEICGKYHLSNILS